MSSNEKPEMPKAFIPGLIPTMNNRGFMTEGLDAYSLEFTRFAGTVTGEVLDIGCAYGVATLAALASGARVLAADMDPRHLEVLLGRVPAGQRPRLRTVTATLPDADFPAERFDALLAARVLHFLRPEEVERVALKMFQWLAPGGRLFIVADSPYAGPWYKAATEYERRKLHGERWPGFLEDYRQFLPAGTDMSGQPRSINPMDPDILRRLATESGFVVEKAAFLAGSTPKSPPNAHAGVIARKPG
jgi:SAM-dependent methyltransferase